MNIVVERNNNGNIICTVYLINLLILNAIRQDVLIIKLLPQGPIFISGNSDFYYTNIERHRVDLL